VRSVLTFLFVTVPRAYREWQWRRLQTAVSAQWMEERKRLG